VRAKPVISLPPATLAKLTLVVCALQMGRAAAAAAEKGAAAVTVEKVEYRGWKNNLRISNGDAELIVTLDVGPRVISYKLAGGKNVFKEYDDQLGKSGETEWMIRGGHRLWAAPEDTTRTYALDNSAVAHRELGPGQVRLTPPPDSTYGIQKEIDLTLDPSGSGVKLVHRITNTAKGATVLAVWALSVMAPGGTEVIPLPPKRPHPGSPKNARTSDDFAPTLFLSVWPFTDLQDPRLHLGTKFVMLRQDSRRGPTKLGVAHRSGGVGYLNGGTLFVKRFDYKDGQPYPDRGVNFETFTNEDMLEIESLGPLTALEPGKAVEHVETWALFGNLGSATSEAEIDEKVAPKLK
jgi:hypothetical protein